MHEALEGLCQAGFPECPFDDGYRPIYEAIIFSVIHCGFVIRCAREREDSGEPRISKIVEIIRVTIRHP